MTLPSNAPDTRVSRLVRWLLRYALRRWQGLIGVAATMLLATGLNVLAPWPLKVMVDNALNNEPISASLGRVLQLLPGVSAREGLVAWTAVATLLLFLFGWALALATQYANIAFGQRMVYDLAADLYGHLQRLSLRFHSRKSVGDSIRRITADSACVSVIMEDALLPAFSSSVSLLVMFVIMWRLDPGLTLLALAVVPLMIVTLHRYAAPMEQRAYVQEEAEGRWYDLIEQTLSSMPIVKAFGREDLGNRQFRATTREIVSASLAASNVQNRFKVLTGLATALGTAGALWIGAHRVIAGELTVGGILVFLAYLGSLYGPLETLMYTPSTIKNAAGSARRVLEILESPVEVVDRPGAVALSGVRGHVELEDVTFGYESGRPILKGISLTASAGETVAIVGATGAGKSTLVSLVPRFFDPEGGRVLIDGHDVRDVQVQSLRAQIALVLQEPFLFPLSIADNIAYGRPGAPQAAIEAAARAANAHGFIARLPEGYQTVIGERGGTLSGGERQRLSIARALLKDAPILILDEPTSALDAETEALLLEALQRLMAGRTTFIIAHRLSTIRAADQIVVLDDGMILEQGTHRELLARGGQYARLIDRQTGVVFAVAVE